MLLNIIFPESVVARELQNLSESELIERCRVIYSSQKKLSEKVRKINIGESEDGEKSKGHATKACGTKAFGTKAHVAKKFEVRAFETKKFKIINIFSYKNPLIKEMVGQIKFRGQKKYAKVFAVFLFEEIKKVASMMKNESVATVAESASESAVKFEDKSATDLLGEKILLIPVPIHKKRRRERGFNQCELLCEEIMKIVSVANVVGGANIRGVVNNAEKNLNLQYESEIIVRKIYQDKQSWSDRDQRFKKISGVFDVVLPEKVFGKKIVLVDDVFTTGATLTEIAKCLFVAGAKEVVAITVAH